MQGLNVLVYGSGAREQAIVESVSTSPLAGGVYKSIEADFEILVKNCLDLKIDLVIFGPEKPLVDGAVDILKAYGIDCIGVNKYWAQLEGSKLFAKEFMHRNRIRTAKLASSEFPIVLKADGLCGGKGVIIVNSKSELDDAIKTLKNFGESAEKTFTEEFLDGEELSVMSFFDGQKLTNFAPARDFKKLSADKNSPNTGGMAAFCPVDLSNEQNTALEEYLQQLQSALIKEKADFKGFIYSGLIWARENWYVLEYNMRLGDPETQAILNHLENDFLSILLGLEPPKYKKNKTAVLTIAAKGYPQNPIIGDEITLPQDDDVKVYLAGVKKEAEKLYSNGGRVLSLCTSEPNPFEKLREFANKIQMKNKYFREDIN